MKTMGAAVKGFAAFAAVIVAYVDTNLGPLFWALLVLAALDILLNVHDESKQWNKLGSAFVTLGGTYGVGAHFGQPDFVRILVAVAVLAYIQIVVPQVFTLLTKLKLGGPLAAQSEIAALKAEVNQLKTQAVEQAGGTAPAPASSTSTSASTKVNV